MFNEEELLTLLFCVRYMSLTPDIPGVEKLIELCKKIENIILKKEEKELKS